MSRKVLSSLGRWRVVLGSLLVAGMALMVHALTDPNEGLEVVAGTTAGSFELVWHGKPGRTYFIQTSDTLMPDSWTYLPAIESGTNAAIEWGFTNSTARGFLRLRHTDQTYTGPVGAADFDTDGLTNNAELQTHHTDPLDGDSDDDGLNDGLEITLGTNPWSGDSDGDGVGDGTENSNGSNPTDSTAQPNKEYWVKMRYWSRAQHHVWRTVDRGEYNEPEFRWVTSQSKSIDGVNASPPDSYSSSAGAAITLDDYEPPTDWGTLNTTDTGRTYNTRAEWIETSLSTRIDKEWRALGYKLQLETTQPMSRDYTLKFDVYRERKEGSHLAAVTRTFVETVTLTLPKNESASNAWEAVYAPELGFIDEYFITPRPEVKTQNITFGGTNYLELKSDDGQITYRGTHWYDGDRDGTADPENYAVSIPERNRPVAYVAGTKPKLSAKIRSRGITDAYGMQVRAKINGTIDLPETWCYRTLDGYHTLEPTETTQALISNIGFYNAQAGSAFEIKWEFKKGTEWLEMATTKHTVYLVRSAPISTANTLRRETLFNIGCKAANGMSTSASEADIVNAIYGEFTDRSVKRVSRSSGDVAGAALTYWQPGNIGGTTTLLNSGDSRCGGWAVFFVDVLRTQGIDAVATAITPPSPSASAVQADVTANFPGKGHQTLLAQLYVKNWDLSGAPFNSTPISGVAAQGDSNDDPNSEFNDHALVLHGGYYYDPSYGTQRVGGIPDWEAASVASFGAKVEIISNILGQPVPVVHKWIPATPWTSHATPSSMGY